MQLSNIHKDKHATVVINNAIYNDWRSKTAEYEEKKNSDNAKIASLPRNSIAAAFISNARDITDAGPPELSMPRVKATAYDGFEQGVKAAADAYARKKANETGFGERILQLVGLAPKKVETDVLSQAHKRVNKKRLTPN